jgi:hypothetical protein
VTLLWLSRRSVPEPFSEQFDCLARQARSARIAPGGRCLPHSLAASSTAGRRRFASWLLVRSSRQRRAIRLDCLPRQARCVRWLAALAAMFAGEPPSSSNPTKRMCRRISSVLDSFRRLRLQIGGANIAGADRAWRPLSSSLARSSQHGGAPAVRELLLARSSRQRRTIRSMISPSP